MNQCGEYISNGEHALICNSSYNTHSNAELSKLEHDQQCPQDVSHFVDVRMRLEEIDFGTRAHMFCSTVKFTTLYQMVLGELEMVVKEEKVLVSENPSTQPNTVSK